MQKSMELLQRRNRQQNKIIAEQARAISEFYVALRLALKRLEELHDARDKKIIAVLRKALHDTSCPE